MTRGNKGFDSFKTNTGIGFRFGNEVLGVNLAKKTIFFGYLLELWQELFDRLVQLLGKDFILFRTGLVFLGSSSEPALVPFFPFDSFVL